MIVTLASCAPIWTDCSPSGPTGSAFSWTPCDGPKAVQGFWGRFGRRIWYTNSRIVRLIRMKGNCLRFQSGLLFSLAIALSCQATAAAEAADDANLPIIARYESATKTQQAALRGAQMNVAIVAKLPRLEKQGKLIALRTISTLGKIGYKILGFQGDDTIKQEVIARFLQAEMEATKSEDMAITPANYKFRHKGSI